MFEIKAVTALFNEAKEGGKVRRIEKKNERILIDVAFGVFWLEYISSL